MPYIYNTPRQQQEMLTAIGAASIEELFDLVPEPLRLNRPLDIPSAMGELELTQHMSALAAKNDHAGTHACFLGGGSYDHFIPAAVDVIGSRSEFYTSYTPYQPEVSQGNLQVTFEYQTLICQLTGMEVSNASLYDGGSAATEAVLLALGTNRRQKVVTAASVHPEYRQTLETYFANLDADLITVGTPDGRIDPEELATAVDETTSCVLLQHPNFFGSLEEVEQIAQITHDAGALLIVSVDPLSLGLLKRPGDYGADVVVAEGQSLGNPMAYGGPYLGIMACRESFVRRMPGRIAGQTVDRRGKRCWVLTLQTREQHIRRAKATSNICTNQGLFALRASVYLSLMGPQGMRDAATLCLRKANYAQQTITANERFELAFDTPNFKEFVIRDKADDVENLVTDAHQRGYFAGVPLGRWYPELSDCLLIAVTERRTRGEIDGLSATLVSTVNEEASIHA